MEPRVLLLGAEWFTDDPGGLNRYFRDLVLALAADGRSPRAVVVGPASDPPPGAAVVDRGPLPIRLWRYGRLARRLGAATGLVDSHFALYGVAAVLARVVAARPLVVHFHGPWADEATAAGDRSRPKRAAKRALERFVYRRAALAITLSGSFKRLLVERYGMAPWTVAVLSPAVDLKRFTPGDRGRARTELGLPARGQLVVSIRRLVPRMGLDVLLRAWAALDSPPGRRLVVVGEGPEREHLERLADQLGVGASVALRGRVGEEELVAWYRAADLSVVPSLALEGFGLTVLESLACGTPVVTSDAGGLPEATRGMAKRVIVPAGESAPLATAIDGVLGGELASPSARECRAHAERHSLAALADRNLEAYRRAAGGTPARTRRVVYVDHCARLSGAELGLLRIIRSLGGVEPHVILGEEGPLEVRLRESGISTEVLPLASAARDLKRGRVRIGRTGLRAPVLAAAYALRLARRLRSLRPDLIHINTLKAGLYGAPAACLSRCPVVWHLHDRLAGDYMPRQAAALARAAIDRFSDQVIVNSETTLRTLGERGARKSEVIPNPIELPASAVEIRDRVKRVGILGRLAPWKGQHVFLDAFARTFPAPGVEAVVIGAPLFGEDAYAEDLRLRARELGIEDRVAFRGHVHDVAAELARLDLLVHASTVPEPFGQVVLEGLAAGLPVVAAAPGGPTEIVRDGVDGLLYRAGDVAALSERLRALSGDRGLRVRLGDAGRTRARDFAPEAVAPMVEAVYGRILDGRMEGEAARRPRRAR